MRRRTVKREVLVTHFPLRRNFLFLANVSLVVFLSRFDSAKYSQVRMKPEAKVSSQDFFTRYAKDLNLSKDDAFKPVFSRPNPLHRAKSQVVIRYQQQYKNLPVIGTGYVLQTDAANHVLAASGKIISGLKVDINPSVSESP